MLRILFIEDQEEATESVLREIRLVDMGIETSVCTFDDAEIELRSLRPHIVVLDLWEGDVSDDENRGSAHLDFIWNRQFCPVIIHSAQPDIPAEHKNSFVREVTKGQNSPQLVLEAIDALRPHVEALKGAEEHIRNSFSIAMRDVAPSTFTYYTDVDQRNDAVYRSGRRRLAALMDQMSGDGQQMASWEQYICPPVSQDILLGDILKEADGAGQQPTLYRIVLTPSCDLVASGGRVPKVTKVLAAKCCSMGNGLALTSLNNLSPQRLRDRLINTVLSRGFFETMIPFPALEGRVPTMLADLRELELIPLSDVGLKDKPSVRIASLDSPFRELISWAYVQVAGRPGLPDRDFASWRDEIMGTYGDPT